MRLLRHRWADGALHQTLPPDMLQRLAQRITASEQRHTGQIRHGRPRAACPVPHLARRRRARARHHQFGKLRVWDMGGQQRRAIHLLLADHAIEIAPRSRPTQHVAPANLAHDGNNTMTEASRDMARMD